MYNKSTFFTLEDEFKFGKHQEMSLREVLESYPDYFVWCLKNLNHLWMSSELIEDIRDNYPKYVLTTDEFAGGNYEGIKTMHIADFLLMEEF